MLRGDLATMPLTDVLQWAEAARRNVRIEIERESGLGAWMITHEREVIASSMPHVRGVLASDGTPDAPGPGLRAAAIESLLDLFLETQGRFTLRDVSESGPASSEAAVKLAVPLGFLVMEGLRQLDEWPRLASTYPDDAARLRAIGTAPDDELGAVQAAILEQARRPFGSGTPTLAEMQLVLGLSRTALLRRVDELRAIGCVEVEGALPGARDLAATLIDQAAVLVREEQFAEAAHVLRSLLASSPADTRVRRLLEQTERAHLAACYAQLAKTDVVRIARPPSSAISSADQALLDALAQKPRSVAALTLLSPLRELETLLALIRLRKKGIVEVSPA
ncbi:DUF4388 domain-containing protein [Sandaracinus amylolyticus]|uniref:PatA-like N-terminal domain-containing protein n=1 Tax=Sandaracinus amylolyticus TaxID=927083 RepID=A0A0F6W925_9BACT|nr:DUF4388 domain-containing protein [Sandaracinus amylolyticus]AKF10587.1 hypothetical protein DB32_007736 [Sandaracinus amylolyticus]